MTDDDLIEAMVQVSDDKGVYYSAYPANEVAGAILAKFEAMGLKVVGREPTKAMIERAGMVKTTEAKLTVSWDAAPWRPGAK